MAFAQRLSPAAPLLVGSFSPVTNVDVLTEENFLSEKDLDALVKKYKALNPDVFLGKNKKKRWKIHFLLVA
jgi:hypothetical protein